MPIKETITIKSRIDNIEADLYLPDNWNKEKLIICCHGFNSGKDSDSYNSICNALLDNSIACVRFSLPYHAERRIDVNEAGDFTVENCIEDSELVEKTIRERYPSTKIGLIATSFGGYLTLLRLKRYRHNYFAVILKSPAIRMDEILKYSLTSEEFEFFKKQGFGFDKNIQKKMKINFSFYEELENNRIMDNPKYNDDILLYHGTIDELAPFKDSKEFADLNDNTTLVPLEGEHHSFSQTGLKRFCDEVTEYLLIK